MSEKYSIDLVQSTPSGVRRLEFHASLGEVLEDTGNGELVISNEQEGTIIKINPYAWQTLEISGIDTTQEDVDD